jgi:glycerophosphoryl diester phosphodiesterase
VKELFQDLLMHAVDAVTAVIPQPAPDETSLRACKLVAHRGEHDNHSIFENTLPAFAAARDAGVWGIECDIRWTRDLVPVVMHDADGERVFGEPVVVGDLRLGELNDSLPAVPSLEELVADFGGTIHLMLEIKADAYPEPETQRAILADTLAGLEPVRDYHFLALDPTLFQHANFAPPAAMLPVAEFNVAELSRLSLSSGYGGLTGHYRLLGNRLKRRHEAAGQKIGTGHIGSRNALFRELNRGVEWIFSNDAVEMQALRDRHLDKE